MNPTPQQKAFLDAVTETDRNIGLIARAGCGKTTAILMAVKAYAEKYPDNIIHVCAFNKAIAVEVGDKLKASGFTDWQKYGASTLHSMGAGLVNFAFKKPVVNENKIQDIIYFLQEQESSLQTTYKLYIGQILALVRYAKQSAVGFFDDMPIGDKTVWYKLAEHYDVNGFDDTSIIDQVVEAAQEVYRRSLNWTETIDYDDMILFPLVYNIKVKYTKDLILVDEYQDVSRAKQALARKFLKPGGRMMAIGDDRQAIYGFTGADSKALSSFIEQMDAITLPLSVTWRCPKSVVNEANKLVPDLEAADSAIDGEVIRTNQMPEDLIPGKEEDAILCRNMAPLVGIAYSLITSGVPCKVEGRKIGEGLINLVNRWGKDITTSKLIDRLENYKDREIQKALAKGNESKVQEVEDKVGTILEIIKVLNKENKTKASDVVEFIDNLFADGKDKVVTLATYHRSKGREWKRVILLEHASRCPSKYARQVWQKEQEINLAYVAITRAKRTLIYLR